VCQDRNQHFGIVLKCEKDRFAEFLPQVADTFFVGSEPVIEVRMFNGAERVFEVRDVVDQQVEGRFRDDSDWLCCHWFIAVLSGLRTRRLRVGHHGHPLRWHL